MVWVRKFLRGTENSAVLVMGDLQMCLSPCSSSNSSSLSLDLFPLSIDSELWLMAERRTQEILWTIQPALASEQKRKEVIDYIQRLIKCRCATEVFPFGSVPLKTYLPDGDIDLTALSHKNVEEDLAREVCNILTYAEQDSQSEVKDVRFIQAQVKIVKCSVKNVAVDISFNQMAGLCALCFLEQIDQLVGRDHLFKHSVILIKAWCFYESRILGAHHGLLSTYAIEILVLYIINAFHSSLPGPLAIVYKFLEYYSTFDWDNYCVTIIGPVAISSLPEIVVGSPDNNGNELLLSQEFLKRCKEKFSGPIKAVENGGNEFSVKHLNILDPLKDNNNLGRSVSKGSFHRIKCALSYGAQRLREILMLPGEYMGARLENFFTNTLDRNGRGERPDTLVPVPAFGTGRSEASDLCGNYDNAYNGLLQGQWYHNYSLPISPQMTPPSSPSQILQSCAWDNLSLFLRCKQNVLSQRGTNVFVPRVPHHHPYVSKVFATASSVDEIGKSRGTGTYIPDVSHHPYKDILSWMSEKKLDSPTHTPLNSPQSTEVEGGSEAKNKHDRCPEISLDQFKAGEENRENGNCMNLSLDQFPLPCCKRSMKSEINQSSDPILQSEQAEDSSTSSRSIQFGTFGQIPSPLVLPLTVTGPCIQEKGTSKQQETLETDVGFSNSPFTTVCAFTEESK